MIDVYWGEFTVSPIPLDMSLNRCSHECTYCFANLNQPGRTTDMAKMLRLLKDYPERGSLVAWLLRGGYPVLISNRCDPFAESNWRQTLAMVEMLTGLGIPLTFQTKGGQGIDEVLDIIGPSWWYVSISTLDDALARRIEPGAPRPTQRLELIRKLTETGQYVVVGLNPCVPEWQPDPLPLVAAAKQAGARGCWIETLHLDRRQIARMGQSARDALGGNLLERAQKRKVSGADWDGFVAARAACDAAGVPVFSMHQPNRSSFWEMWEETYERLFPVTQGFVNLCHDAGLRYGDFIAFDTYADYMTRDLPDDVLPLDSYIGAVARNVFRTHKVPTEMTYLQLLAIIWAEPRVKFSPSRMPCFAYAATWDEGKGGWIQLVDEAGLPYLFFDPVGGFETYFVEAMAVMDGSERR